MAFFLLGVVWDGSGVIVINEIVLLCKVYVGIKVASMII